LRKKKSTGTGKNEKKRKKKKKKKKKEKERKQKKRGVSGLKEGLGLSWKKGIKGPASEKKEPPLNFEISVFFAGRGSS